MAVVTITYNGDHFQNQEMRLVQIWGGIHFRTSLEVSDRMGQAIIKHLAETTYRPVD